jgi:hypothetical protein
MISCVAPGWPSFPSTKIGVEGKDQFLTVPDRVSALDLLTFGLIAPGLRSAPVGPKFFYPARRFAILCPPSGRRLQAKAFNSHGLPGWAHRRPPAMTLTSGRLSIRSARAWTISGTPRKPVRKSSSTVVSNVIVLCVGSASSLGRRAFCSSQRAARSVHVANPGDRPRHFSCCLLDQLA